MSFKSWVVPLTLVGSVIIIQFSDVSGNPLTPLNRLPSITIDTLYTGKLIKPNSEETP